MTAVKSVLVVEDETAIREVLAEALDLEGYKVHTATNGVEALEQIRAQPPNAVVLDLMMPVMDGWEFLEACRREALCAGVPVLVMSAYRNLAQIAPELGSAACIAKPFDLEVLLGAVEGLLRRAA